LLNREHDVEQWKTQILKLIYVTQILMLIVKYI
jgi:hypothetical protein